MNHEEINQVLAAFHGFKRTQGYRSGGDWVAEAWSGPYNYVEPPDYCTNANALQELETLKVRDAEMRKNYLEHAVRVTFREWGPAVSAFMATTAMRAEALARTVKGEYAYGPPLDKPPGQQKKK